MVRTDPKRIVAAGYDRIAQAYLDQRERKPTQPTQRYIDRATDGLTPDARVLDIGCGAGKPYTRWLSERFRVTGVDISAAQLALARRIAPAATLLRADMGSLDFRPASFDAVVSLYAIIHLPREEHEPLFRRIASWLRPGGRVFAVTGQQVWEGREDFLVDGVEMFWSHYGRDTYLAIADRAGLRVIESEVVPDPMGGSHLFLLAERPA